MPRGRLYAFRRHARDISDDDISLMVSLLRNAAEHERARPKQTSDDSPQSPHPVPIPTLYDTLHTRFAANGHDSSDSNDSKRALIYYTRELLDKLALAATIGPEQQQQRQRQLSPEITNELYRLRQSSHERTSWWYIAPETLDPAIYPTPFSVLAKYPELALSVIDKAVLILEVESEKRTASRADKPTPTPTSRPAQPTPLTKYQESKLRRVPLVDTSGTIPANFSFSLELYATHDPSHLFEQNTSKLTSADIDQCLRFVQTDTNTQADKRSVLSRTLHPILFYLSPDNLLSGPIVVRDPLARTCLLDMLNILSATMFPITDPQQNPKLSPTAHPYESLIASDVLTRNDVDRVMRAATQELRRLRARKEREPNS